MDSVSCLRADHELLRKKTLLLESALQIGPEARLMLREMSDSLTRLLETHGRREAPLLQRYGQERAGTPLHVPDHAVERMLFRAVNRLLVGPLRAPVPIIILRLSQAVEQLRVQMDRQERLVFPVFDDAPAPGETGAVPLDGAMSVNEVLHRYPRARRVFDELSINRLDEGADSVDEVAWRHGMEATEVLQRLRSALAGVPSYWYGE
ncbi:MAG: hypothetical protein HY598_04450 [Candidatus Omnitrophica bacterium]|nr:hypothetical protein [Candidatus Omnitrophota bacterium]